MHTLALAAVEIPELQEDLEENARVEETIAKIEQVLTERDDGNVWLDFLRGEYGSQRTTFARKVTQVLSQRLERYNVATEDSDYLEFEDRTEELFEEYEGTTDCLKLPQGTIVPVCGAPYYGRFIIRDGRVLERNSGPAKQCRRTKRAKRIKAIPAYPWKKLYPSLREYAEKYACCDYVAEENAYGHYTNPDGMWDWYSIGGRWPCLLLVRDSCTEYIASQKSWTSRDQLPEAPDGYIWVSAARKKDIAWQALRECKVKQATEQFVKLEHFFLTGEQDENFPGSIVDNGILFWGEYLYYKGETLEEYLSRCGYGENVRYPITVNDLVNGDGWQSKDCPSWYSKSGDDLETWDAAVDAFLDDMPDEDVLVVVDYHS